MILDGPYDRVRDSKSSRVERVGDLEVRIDSIRREWFIGDDSYVTVLKAVDLYTAHITRDGKYVPIYWTWIEPGPPSKTWTSMSHGAVSNSGSGWDLVRDLRALPPEAIG